MHCFYRKSLLIQGFRCFSNDDGFYGRILCTDISKLSDRRSGSNLFVSVSQTQKRDKHLKPCASIYIPFFRASLLSRNGDGVYGCILCIRIMHLQIFGCNLRMNMFLYVSQAQKRGRTSETLIVDAFIRNPFLRVLGVSETTMTCMVHFCALTHWIKIGIEFADAICLCLRINRKKKANTQNPVTEEASVSNLFFGVLGVSDTTTTACVV